MDHPFESFGEEGFVALAAAFYRRVRFDDIVGALYPKDPRVLEMAEQRMADFLIYRFGGSDRYYQERGHPCLARRHDWMRIGLTQRDRWLELMTAAMDEVGLTGAARGRLDTFFSDTADALVNVEEAPAEPPASTTALNEVDDEEL